MDLANLINQLESIIESGRKVPVANKTLVDTEQILSVIDQLRASIPKDIQEAKEMLEKRDLQQQFNDLIELSLYAFFLLLIIVKSYYIHI